MALAGHGFISPQANAQTPTPTPTLAPTELPPISDSTQVSATMPDIVAPSTPILINPANNSLVNTSQPTFVWVESTDNVAVSHYILTIDGEVKLTNLSTTGSFDDYNLSYDSTTGRYSLKYKTSLSQGDHTWKITAVDTSDNSSGSATWSFEIDSVAPTFVIEKIGDEEVSISAQDVDTVPEQAIELEHNEPIILASGEANSHVVISVEYNSEKFSDGEGLDGDGDWWYQLPIFPRDTVINLDFVITDRALHISAIEDVKIIIPSAVIVIPPGTTVTPTQIPTAGPSPTLGPSPPPGAGTPAPGVTITPEPTSKQIRVPWVPPKEVVYELTPPMIKKITRIPWIQQLLNWLGPWLALLVLVWPAMIAILLLARDYGRELTSGALAQILKILGLWPLADSDERQGYVVDSQQLTGAGFGRVTFVSQVEQHLNQLQINNQAYQAAAALPPIVVSALADDRGLYLPVELPPHTYRASVKQPDCRFPSSRNRPEYLEIDQFYQAQMFKISPQHPEKGLIIPVDSVDVTNSTTATNLTSSLKADINLTKIKTWLAQVTLYQHWLNYLLWLLAAIVCLFYPTVVNLLSLTIYTLCWLKRRYWPTFSSNLTGVVVDRQGNPLTQVAIKLTEIVQVDTLSANTSLSNTSLSNPSLSNPSLSNSSPQNPDTTSTDASLANSTKTGLATKTGSVRMTLTDQDGRFEFRAGQGKFKLEASKIGWVQSVQQSLNPSNASLTPDSTSLLVNINSRLNPQRVVVMMHQA